MKAFFTVVVFCFQKWTNGIQAGVSGSPRITHISDFGARHFAVHWVAPPEGSGTVRQYDLVWHSYHDNVTKGRHIRGHLDYSMTSTITGLEPYTTYNLQIRALTDEGYTEVSPGYIALTDVEGPSAPRILNITVLTPNSLYLQWERPEIVYRAVNEYGIRYRSASGQISEQSEISGQITETVLSDIPTNHTYYLKIAGSTRSIYSGDDILGDFSDEVQFVLSG